MAKKKTTVKRRSVGKAVFIAIATLLCPPVGAITIIRDAAKARAVKREDTERHAQIDQLIADNKKETVKGSNAKNTEKKPNKAKEEGS